jgi:hypothetical protein
MATSSSSSTHAVPEAYKNIRMVMNESVEDEELQMKWRDVIKYIINWDMEIDYSCWYNVVDWGLNDPVTAIHLLKLPQEERTVLTELYRVM